MSRENSKKDMRRINLFLNDIESKNLDSLLNKYGGKAPEYLRTLIKNAFSKEFGGYKTKAVRFVLPQEELTDEQFCEKFGGKVKKDDGSGGKCEIKMGGSVVSIMLTDRKTIKQYGKEN